MALSTKRRRWLSRRQFAVPGKRKYPIDTKSRARNALSRVAQHGSASQQQRVRAAVRRRYPSINVGGSKRSRRSRRSRRR